MVKRAMVMDFLAMRSARRQPRARGSWLYGAGPFALIVATGLTVHTFGLPYGWQILIIVLMGVVVCPALVLLATAVLGRNSNDAGDL